MNDDTDEQVLKEIRRLRRGCEIAYVLLMLAAGVLVFAIHTDVKAKAQRQKQSESWETVRNAMNRFDFDKAYETAQRIVTRYPSNYYGHAYLGSISIAAGRFQDAERHYSRACELLPTEDNEKMLEAVRKRLTGMASEHQAAARTNPR